MKPRKYAEAGIPHYLRIENEDAAPVAHVCERDGATQVYAPAGFRGPLTCPFPYPIELDLIRLVPRPRS